MSRSIGLWTVELAVAVALLAVDEVAVVAVEQRLGLGETRLVLAVELLVVGAEGGVGDLETRLRLGRHRSEPRGAGGRRNVAVSLARAARATIRVPARRWPSGRPQPG